MMAMRTTTASVVDTVLAALSVTAAIMLIHVAESLTGLKLFEAKMIASATVFSSNPRPPGPRAFLVCSACAVAAGVALHSAGAHGKSGPAIIAGLHLLFSKLSGNSFASTAGLAQFLASPWDEWSKPVAFVFTPWLFGHTLLYLFALVAAAIRQRVRIFLVQRSWSLETLQAAKVGSGDMATTSRERLRSLFKTYDTSGDGRIDAVELRVAYRALARVDLSLEDCQGMIRAFDADGNGTIDFEEFCHAVDPWVSVSQGRTSSMAGGAAAKTSTAKAE